MGEGRSIRVKILSSARQINRPLAKVDFRPPDPPILGGQYIQSPPELGDLGGFSGFMQEVYSVWGLATNGLNYQFVYIQSGNPPIYQLMSLLNLYEFESSIRLLQVLKAICKLQGNSSDAGL